MDNIMHTDEQPMEKEDEQHDKESEECLVEESVNIDQSLEDKAAFSNLSVQNVKSIIHHVLKDERVIQMVQKIAEKGSAKDEVIFEPKLTRSRVRQAVASTSIYSPSKASTVSATPSPNKATRGLPVCEMPHALLGLQFSEEISDEEYDPDNENTKDTEDLESDILEDDEIQLDDLEHNTDKEDNEESDMNSNASTPKPSERSTTPSSLQGMDEITPTKSDLEGEQLLKTSVEEQTANNKVSPIIIPLSASSIQSSAIIPTDTASISEDDLVKETAVLLASLSDTILSPVKSARSILPPSLPPTESTAAVSDDTDNGEIAHRTRSKLPLLDKDIDEIEASFVPPDVPLDDSVINTPSTCMEFDEDELHWQKWLADLMNPPKSQEDQDDDTDYNFYADHHEDEGEEFRTDRGVKIPQKEADELIEEILNPNSGFFNTDFTHLNTFGLETDEGRDTEEMGVATMAGQSTMDPTSAYLLESLGLHLPTNPTPKKTNTTINQEGHDGVLEGSVSQDKNSEGELLYLSNNHTVRLWDQIQQHFQLLLQTFILTRHEPSLVFLSQIATQALEEMINLCSATKEGSGRSIWYVPGVEEGKELVTRYNPHNPDSVELVQAVGQPPKIPIQVQEIIMNYGVFWQYPNLIPEIGFYALDHPTSSKYFLPSEDGLLALGMDHYGSSAWKLIQQNLLPVKAPRQLNLRVKNLSSARQKTDNIVKYYKRTGKILLPFPKEKDDDLEIDATEYNSNSSGVKLPQWVQMYHRKRIEKEKTEEKRREKELEAMVKLVKTATAAGTAVAGSDITNHQSVVGSKRSLSEQFNAVDSSAKRNRKMSSDKLDSVPAIIQTKRKRSTCATNKSPVTVGDSDEYNQLLYLAGLEANDPAARFAYKYLTEVKATVMDSPGVYDKFLRLITKARKRNWRPVKLYIHVCDVLRPWPHLLKLFMGFVGPLDAIEANVQEEKMEFEQIKSFVNTLEKKYSNSPLQLEEIVTTMEELSNEEALTQQKVFSSLCPLIETHEDLIQDLNSFIHGIKLPTCNRETTPHYTRDTMPPCNGDTTMNERFGNDDFEEIDTIGKRTLTDVDDYEEMNITDDWTPLCDNEDSPIHNSTDKIQQQQSENSTINDNNSRTMYSMVADGDVINNDENGAAMEINRADMKITDRLSSTDDVTVTGDTVTGDINTGVTVTGDVNTDATVTGDINTDATVTGDTVTGDIVTGDIATGDMVITGITGAGDAHTTDCSLLATPLVADSVSTIASVTSTGSIGTTLSQTVTASCTLLQDDDNDAGSQQVGVAYEQSRNWTRDDDRFLLQACLQGDPTEGSTDTLNVIANHLNRSLDEVRLRCSELLTMMKSMAN